MPNRSKMGNGKNSENRSWSPMRPHEEFLELCAVSTTGELSEDEQAKLKEHLAECSACRQALEEFEAVADVGAPLLAAGLLAPSASSGSIELLASGATDRESEEVHEAGKSGHLRFPDRSQVNWNYVWMPFAAAVVLTVALGIYAYRIGNRHSSQFAQRMSPSEVNGKLNTLEGQLSDAGHEREAFLAQLAGRDRLIGALQRQMRSQSAALAEAKSTEASLQRTVQNEQDLKEQITQEQNGLREKLSASEASLETTRSELDSAQRDRQHDQLLGEDLEAQIKDLNAQLRSSEQKIGKQDDFLAEDRDIRDLMGARDLYIAEVYDVARDGATRKPYGRVFFTKGKSLIFYAYDLDQQPGARNASTFQAWGQSGPDREQAINLGIFYEDSVAKKRWVLKFDDGRKLDQINAVFVTVEPQGGSHKPNGKPLLFASLRIDPNHP